MQGQHLPGVRMEDGPYRPELQREYVHFMQGIDIDVLRIGGIEVRTGSALGEAVTLEAKGRHDPCVLPRAVPIVEAAVLMVLADHWLRQAALEGAAPR